MAKKAKLSVDSPSQAVEDPVWQSRSDAHDIMRYAEIKSDKSRHNRALQHIRAAADCTGTAGTICADGPVTVVISEAATAANSGTLTAYTLLDLTMYNWTVVPANTPAASRGMVSALAYMDPGETTSTAHRGMLLGVGP